MTARTGPAGTGSTARSTEGSTEGSTAVVDGGPGPVDADAVAAATAACRTVAGLSGGPAGAVATYLPGRRVVGVRIDDRALAVHVVGVYGPSVAEIGADVRAALARLAGPREVEVVVEDLATPAAGTEPADPGSARTGPARTGPGR